MVKNMIIIALSVLCIGFQMLGGMEYSYYSHTRHPGWVIPNSYIRVPPTYLTTKRPIISVKKKAQGLHDKKSQSGDENNDAVIWPIPHSSKIFADSCAALYESLGQQQALKELTLWAVFIDPQFEDLAQQMKKQNIYPIVRVRKMLRLPIT